jgi:2-polyprenyl-3-methyl-5-hydroxy-6-metoxy-1,4-benzoquinol methylase
MREDRGLIYDAAYYRSHCGLPYERSAHWLTFFGGIADRIVKTLKPRTLVDAGCAMGFLVEALRDRGVEARGFDISSYAISQVREDIKPYCRVGSIVEPIPGRFDLVTCIEVFEHLPAEEGRRAAANLSAITDRILFSSTPDDFAEPTHLNVQLRAYWLRLFPEFRHSRYDARYIAPHAMLLKRRYFSSLTRMLRNSTRVP